MEPTGFALSLRAPVGEVLVWLTDDERKFVVRLETKIKIGTIVAKLKSLEKGQE